MGPRAAAIAFVAVVAFATLDARAQSDSAAEALFRDGLKLLESGETKQACAKFAESYKLEAANGTLQNLAACHERSGMIASAWANWSLLAGRAAAANQKTREELARRKASELEKRLFRVQLRVPDAHPATTILVDGSELARGAWSTALPLDPGPHTIRFAARGFVSREQTVDVPAHAGSMDVGAPALEKEPLVVAESPGSREPTATPPLRTVSYVTIGIGSVALVAGGVLGAIAMSAKGDLTNHCTGEFCDPHGLASNDRAHGFATASTIVVGAGAVLLAAGVVMLLTSPRSSSTASTARSLAVTFR